jgi:hypothetical protein
MTWNEIIKSSNKTNVIYTVAILACKSWWGKLPPNVLGCMPAKPLHNTTQHNTKQYMNCTKKVINGDHKLLGPT